MSKTVLSKRIELKVARSRWDELGPAAEKELLQLMEKHNLSVSLGDVIHLNHRWYVTHSGLLRLAHRKRFVGIKTSLDKQLSDPASSRWVFKATVYKGAGSVGFVGYGDADPSNVSPTVRGAELRMAETRATNRALRKALGLGICSFEELGLLPGSHDSIPDSSQRATPYSNQGSNNGHPRLRDKLCLLIRQYNLDPNLVKAYAADFCGTEKLSGASREMVESFINQLAKSAKENRDSLVCKLNSYAQPQGVSS